MGVAPEQHFDARVGALLFKIVKVDGPAVFGVDQIGTENRYVVVLRRMQEVAVGRCGDDEGLALADQILHQLIEGRDDAGREAELLLFEAPAVALFAPAVEGLVIGVVEHHGVAEDALVHALFDGVADGGAAGKLHVRNPHADELFILERENLFRTRVEDVAPESVGVEGVGVSAVNDLVKIVLHRVSLPSPCILHGQKYTRNKASLQQRAYEAMLFDCAFTAASDRNIAFSRKKRLPFFPLWEPRKSFFRFMPVRCR